MLDMKPGLLFSTSVSKLVCPDLGVERQQPELFTTQRWGKRSNSWHQLGLRQSQHDCLQNKQCELWNSYL